MDGLILTDEDRMRRMRQLGYFKDTPMNRIRLSSFFGFDVDYIPGYDDGEPPKHVKNY